MATIVTRAGKGSALTWTEGDDNITNLNNDKIENVVDDTTPQLGGNLDLNGNKLVGGSYGGNTVELPVGFGPVITNGYEDAITLQSSSDNTTFKQWKFKNDGTTQFPSYTFPAADGTADYVLKTNGSGTLSWVAMGGGGIADVVDDTTPQLGGDLDTNGKNFVNTSTSSPDIVLTPNPTMGGVIKLASSLDVQTSVISSSVGNVAIYPYPTYKVEINGDLDVKTHSITTTTTDGNIAITPNGAGKIVLDSLYWPTADGTADQVLKTDGSGNLSWATPSSGGITDVVQDTTPQLGGNLDVQANIITTSVTNGNITITPNGTGDVILSTDTVQIGESTTQGKLTTSGGSIQISTNNGTTTGTINITAGANGNITLIPNGTGKSVMNALNYNEGAIYDLGTTGGTIAPIVTNGNVQKITLNSALTINGFGGGPTAGQSLTLIIYGGTAYTSITSTMKFAGGVKTLTATAGCIDILTVYYDGTTYFASLGKGYA